MTIYVVKPGDSLWSIGKKFGVIPGHIADVNKIKDPRNLVTGQTLIIPSKEKQYIIKPGDTIWSVSKKFGVSVNSILERNKISNSSAVYPGLVIKIPEKSKNYGYMEVNGFIQPSNPLKERAVLGESIMYLTYVTPFSHHVNADGSLTPLNDAVILQTAKANNTASMLSVTNISGDNFDSKLISNILNSDELSQTLINNILNLIKSKGSYGVIVDFERIPPEGREKYNDFLRKLVSRLHPQYLVATALAPKTSDIKTGSWHGAHDYKAQGEIVDFVIIMTYEWGWSGGPPMAVAPLNEVRKVINYAVSVIPPKKIMMGIPLYGYDWTLPYTAKAEFAEAIGNQAAIDRAAKYKTIIKYDEKAESPYYKYFDKNGKEHVVWFEDARSVEAKYKLASEYGLRGVSYWSLVQPFPQNWQVLDNMFKIVKL